MIPRVGIEKIKEREKENKPKTERKRILLRVSLMELLGVKLVGLTALRLACVAGVRKGGARELGRETF